MSYSTTTTPSTATLFHQAQAGDAASLDHLMQQHDGLVHHIIRQQWSGPLTYAETLQEGRIGLTLRLTTCGARYEALIPRAAPPFRPTPA
jgi:hypothetical protein